MATNRLMNYVKANSNQIALPPVMPLMHSCSGLAGRAILTSNTLRTSYCRSFHEPLLYFFYGKPSYPAGAKYTLHHPVCFIVDTKSVVMNRVHPFDTGAFFYGLYREHLTPFASLCDYELDTNIGTVQSYVHAVYGDNTNYFRGISKPQLKQPDDLKRFFHLITDKTIPRNLSDVRPCVKNSTIDGRSRTIEIATTSSVSLTKSLLCVILPDTLLRDKDIFRFLKMNSIEYITYCENINLAPSEYDQIVFELVTQYLQKSKIIL